MLDLELRELLNLSYAHIVTQGEVQHKVREALIEQLDEVGLGSVRSDPETVPVDEHGLPTWSPLTAPMVVNAHTLGELDDLLDILKTNANERQTDTDPLLGGEV